MARPLQLDVDRLRLLTVRVCDATRGHKGIDITADDGLRRPTASSTAVRARWSDTLADTAIAVAIDEHGAHGDHTSS